MTFVTKTAAKIQANLSDNSSTITVDGITTVEEISPEEITTAVNQVLNIVGKQITATGMKRIITQEVVDNG